MARDTSGIFKNCHCPADKKFRCSHTWTLGFRHGGTYHREAIDKYAGRHIVAKTDAATIGQSMRDDIRAGRWRDGAPVASPAQGVASAQPSSVTLRALAELYVEEYCRVQGLRTVDAESGVLTRAMDTRITLADGTVVAFGDLPATAIAVGHLSALRRARLQQQQRKHCQCPQWATCAHPWRVNAASGRTALNRMLARLRALFTWALRHEHVERSPFRKGDVSAVGLLKERQRYRRLEDGEERRLRAEANPHLLACIECALESGMRLGEILKLTWADVRADLSEIWLQAKDTKAAKVRIVPVSDRLRAVLDMRRRDPAGEDFPAEAHVFGTVTGERVASISKAWRGACQRAGLENLHFHDLRRESGSRLLDSGHFSIGATRDLLGHSNISVTSRYLQGQTGGLRSAMRQRDAALAEASHATVAIYVRVGAGSLAMPIRVPLSAGVSGFIGTHSGHDGYRLEVASPVPDGEVIQGRVVCACGAGCDVSASRGDVLAVLSEIAERAAAMVIPGEAPLSPISRVN